MSRSMHLFTLLLTQCRAVPGLQVFMAFLAVQYVPVAAIGQAN